MNKMVSLVIENSIRYSVKNKLFLKIILAIEMYSILVEILMGIYKLTDRYVVGFEKDLFTADLYKNDYIYILAMISPYLWLRSLYQCDTVSGFALGTFCYFPKLGFFLVIFIMLLLLTVLALITHRYDTNRIIRKTHSLVFVLKPVLYNTIELVYFKILSMGVYYLTINVFISSSYLESKGVDVGLNLFALALSLVYLSLYFVLHLTYIRFFNLIVRLNNNYPYDNYFSTSYDYYLAILKIAIAVENNLVAFNGRVDHLARVLNGFIISFSFVFMSKVLIKLLYKNKTLYFINNRLNSFRINLVIFINMLTIYLLLFGFTVGKFHNGIFLFFIALFTPLSKYLADKICEKNFSLIYREKNLIFVLLYIINYKNNLFLFTDGNENKLDAKKKALKQTAFNHQVTSLYIQHRSICKTIECDICLLDHVTYEGLIYALFKQCEAFITHNQVSSLNRKYFEYVKLLFHFHYENDKRIKLYFETVRSMDRNKHDFILFNNVSLLKSVICVDKKDQTSMFLLINNYEKINNLTDKVIDVLKDLILCSTNGEINLNYLIEDINSIEKRLEKKLIFVSRNKDIYIDDYSLVISRFIYVSLFNKDITDNLSNYTIDIFEERLDSLFSSNYLLLKYQERTNSLVIVSGTKEFAGFKNKPFREVLVERFNFESEFKANIRENKGNQFNYDFLIKTDKGYIKYINSKNTIIQSIKHNDLYVISEFDMKETELLLVKDSQSIAESEEVNVLHLFGKIHLSQVIYYFSEDLARSFYLLPEWVSYLRFYHSNITMTRVFSQSRLKSSKQDSDYLEINYTTYFRTHEKILQKIVFELGHEYFETEESKNLHKELAENAETIKSHTFKLKLLDTLNDEKDETYNLYRIKHMKQFKYNRITNEDESIATDSEKYEVRNTVSSVTSGSQYSDLNIQKNIRSNIENNTVVLRKYSRFTFIFNVLMVIYCCVCLYIGIQNNERYIKLFAIRNNYLVTKNTFYHTLMSIIHNTKLSAAQQEINYLDKYLISELPVKIKRLSNALNDFKDNLYGYSFNQDIQYIFDKQINYTHVYMGDNKKVLMTTQNLKFLDIVYIFLSNSNTFHDILGKSYLYLNIFRENSVTNEIRVQYVSDGFSKAEDLPDYSFMLYELMLNYRLFFNNFSYLEGLLDAEQAVNVATQLYVTMGLTIALLGLHFILIFICKKIIDFLNNIIEVNNKLLIDVFNSHIVKTLVSKLNTLKTLNHYYKENPIKSFNHLRQIRKEFFENNRKEKIKEMKSQMAGVVSTKFNMELEINMINKFTYLTPLKNILYLTFMLYFIYSITIYLFLLKSYTNIDSTTNYIYVNSKVFNNIYNNAILTRFLVFQNKTDIELANYMSADGRYLTKGYLATSIENLLNMNNLLIVRKQQSDIINNYYTKYKNDMMNCDSRLDLFQDPILTDVAKSDSTAVDLVTNVCYSFPVMKTDLDQFFYDYNYKCIHILRAISSNKERDELLQISELDIKELYYMILFLFRPVQAFIMNRINIDGISDANNKYLVFTFVFFSLNIVVDMILCLLLISMWLIDRGVLIIT
jgi:hypothetical protein